MKDHIDVMTARLRAAMIHSQLGNQGKALGYLSALLAQNKRLYGNSAAETAQMNLRLGTLLLKTKKDLEVIKRRQRALTLVLTLNLVLTLTLTLVEPGDLSVRAGFTYL